MHSRTNRLSMKRHGYCTGWTGVEYWSSVTDVFSQFISPVLTEAPNSSYAGVLEVTRDYHGEAC